MTTLRRYLPALRGIFGEWSYYSCLMSLAELATQVSYAEEIHPNKELSKLIQRELRKGRANDISDYLKSNPERFFNSLVVAVYGGAPAWHQLDSVKAMGDDFKAADVSADAVASIGFLSFTGEEKLFALDGQHRLAGVRAALESKPELGEDEVSVIFVAHQNDQAGLIRTRNLFTTLNKTAKPVSKSEIISLDESDVMAIVARELVERQPHFSEGRVLVVEQANLPPLKPTDIHLTTIVNLYDVLTIIFSKIRSKRDLRELQFQRPADEEVAAYRDFALKYFSLLSAAKPELGEYFASQTPADIIAKYRRVDGGSILFRPVGLSMFAQLVDAAVNDSAKPGRSLADAIALVGMLPTDIGAEPYVNLLWNPATQTLDLRRQALVRRLLLFMLGMLKGTNKTSKLKGDLAKARGIEPAAVELPEPVVK